MKLVSFTSVIEMLLLFVRTVRSICGIVDCPSPLKEMSQEDESKEDKPVE